MIVRNVYVVGMHHWGGHSLAIGPVYYCAREPNNPRDPKAVAVFSDDGLSHKVCYLRRRDAAILMPALDYAKGNCYLRAKMAPEKFNRYQGPMQNCSIGFKCLESDVDIVKSLLSQYHTHIF